VIGRSPAAVLAALLTLAGCAPKAPDYQSIWTSSETPTTTSVEAAPKPVPFSQYLEDLGVQGEPVTPTKLTDIAVTLPSPKGWQTYRNPNMSPQTEMIARNNGYPTAMLLVFRLHGNFDVAEAIKHANADAALSQDFTKLNESFADFHGFPSAMIEGSYTLIDRRLHTYSRVVIPVTPAPAFQRYLVQLTVTSLADQAVNQADDIQAIISGFDVKVK
jgi:Probable lipoprotein LpqN